MAENQKGRGSQGGNRGNQSGNQDGSSQRGLASADKATRERVAKEGGKASRGGGRQSENQGGRNR
jgi:hypothetical protein